MSICIYDFVCTDTSTDADMAVDQNPCCRGAPPPLQTFVAGPLLQTLVADLCVEYCSLQGACRRGVCRGGVCRRTPLSVTNLCREMAAQACYKANIFLIRCHVDIDVDMGTQVEVNRKDTDNEGHAYMDT